MVPENSPILQPNHKMSPEVRAKYLARAYAAILSWPDPREKQTELTATDLGGEEAVSPEANTSAIAGGTPPTRPAPQQAVENKISIGGSI